MKKILSFLIVMCMMISVCACSGSDETASSSEANKSSEMSNESSADNSGDLSDDGADDASDDVSDDTSDDASGDVSNNTSSETSSDVSEESSGATDEIVDKDAYELYRELSSVDKTLKNRGFKDKGANKDYVPLNYDKMKAMWISQFDFNSVYCNGASQRSKGSFTTLVEKAFDNLVTLGFNTIIVQVRPNADSFYPSAYYPWSTYVLGSYGKTASYDPIQIMIEEAHERKLSFQAWINPMRGMSPENIAKLNKNYLMAKWKKDSKKSDYLYTYNGICYLNVAYEEVRNLIIGGAAELVRNYDVDGIHMDDYFYFGEEVNFDKKAYNAAKKQNKSLTLQQFRYNNLNKLVSGIYSAIKAENKNVIFGISPAGNLDKMADTYYADVRTWLSRTGYVDYIMPQIYFGMEHQTWAFDDTYQRWSEIVKNPKIKFMAGMSLGKAKLAYESNTGDQYAGTGKNEWIENKDVVKKCLKYAVSQDNFSGYAMFCYQYFFDPVSGKARDYSAQEIKNAKPYLTNLIKGEPIKYKK